MYYGLITEILIIKNVKKIKLVWSDSVKYLGVYLRSARSFACSYRMYRAFNAVFEKGDGKT